MEPSPIDAHYHDTETQEPFFVHAIGIRPVPSRVMDAAQSSSCAAMASSACGKGGRNSGPAAASSHRRAVG